MGTKSAAPDIEDIDLHKAHDQGKYGIIKAMTNCSLLTDGYISVSLLLSRFSASADPCGPLLVHLFSSSSGMA